MKRSITAFLLLTVLFAAGCKSKTALDSNGVPQTLTIAVFGGEDPKMIKEMYVPIRDYLSKKLNMPVEMLFTTDYTAVIEALKSKKAHMAVLSPFSYIIATRATQITPIVVLAYNGVPFSYQSVLITSSQSNIKTIADLKANAKKLTLCFVDPASASGHLIPRAYLTSIGLNPDSAFKETMFAGGHLASVLSVKSRKVDVGCTTTLVFGVMMDKGLIKKDDINVLWTSPPIVSDPIVVINDLNKDLIKKIQDAYLHMDPVIIHNYTKVFLKDTLTRSFMVGNDTMYNGLRRIANGVKDLKQNN